LDIVTVRGRKEPVKIHDLVADLNEPQSPKAKGFCKYFTIAFGYYQQKKWNKALKVLLQLKRHFPNDTSIALFIKRCLDFRAKPEGSMDQWDGSVVLDEQEI
jgi:predicted Zn-dependent protease